MTTEAKESIVKDILQAKEREVQAKYDLCEALKEKSQRIEAERDFLKGTQDARHIFETYEAPFKKARKLSRAEKWKQHLVSNPDILKKLEEYSQGNEGIPWHDKAMEIYDQLSRNIHQRTIDIGNGKYIVLIEKSLPTISFCFVKILAKDLYGENVSVQDDAFGEVPLETEPSSV